VIAKGNCLSLSSSKGSTECCAGLRRARRQSQGVWRKLCGPPGRSNCRFAKTQLIRDRIPEWGANQAGRRNRLGEFCLFYQAIFWQLPAKYALVNVGPTVLVVIVSKFNSEYSSGPFYLLFCASITLTGLAYQLRFSCSGEENVFTQTQQSVPRCICIIKVSWKRRITRAALSTKPESSASRQPRFHSAGKGRITCAALSAATSRA